MEIILEKSENGRLFKLIEHNDNRSRMFSLLLGKY